ncbi:MAG TPA: serine protease [Roseomonas sp.]|jgi:hypothetical protein
MRIEISRPPLLKGLAVLVACAVTLGESPAQAQKPPGQPQVQALPTTKPPALPPVAAAPPRPQGNRPPGPGAQASLPTTKPPPLPPGSSPQRRAVSSGTGFVVAPGRIMTNHHVVDRCQEMRARRQDGTDIVARVLASDQNRDLALLAVDGDVGPPLSFRSNPPPRRGEGVVTYGFPLAGLLSSGPTLTTGDISALAGLGDDARQIQISAPVQPGNSGGPLLDMSGLVVGIVVSKLNAQRVAQRTGDIPQNVNFAVKGAEAIAFLREQRVNITPSEGREPLRSAAEVGEIADRSVLFLRCLR